jgi:hypothetical protein
VSMFAELICGPLRVLDSLLCSGNTRTGWDFTPHRCCLEQKQNTNAAKQTQGLNKQNGLIISPYKQHGREAVFTQLLGHKHFIFVWNSYVSLESFDF